MIHRLSCLIVTVQRGVNVPDRYNILLECVSVTGVCVCGRGGQTGKCLCNYFKFLSLLRFLPRDQLVPVMDVYYQNRFC